MKLKKLISLLGIAGITASASTVVACGPFTFNKLQAKQIDSSTFRTNFATSVTSWNPVQTMQTNDIKLLANLDDTLFSNAKPQQGQKVGQLISQLAYYPTDNNDPNKNDGFNDKKDSYTITFNKDAKWYDHDGNIVRNVSAMDMGNTAKFVLTKKNGSELISNWTQFINGASLISNDLYNRYPDGTSSTTIYNDSEWNNFIVTDLSKKTDNTGLYINKDTNQVTFYLVKSMPYFKTLLTDLSFSPTPEEALGYAQGMNYGQDYKNVLTTGPYHVSEFQTGYILKMEKVKDYYGTNQGSINNIVYNYSQKSDPASIRQLFETGDYNQAQIMPSDTYGWNKYIGNDAKDPKFSGITIVPNNTIGTKNLLFNFTNTDSSIGIDSNKALAFNSVRSLITFAMDRSIFDKYFSGPYDSSNTSSYLRNTFNPSGYLNIDNKDYVDFMDDIYKREIMQANKSTSSDLSDGQDLYLNNPDMIYQALTYKDAIDLYNNGKYIEAIIQQVKEDLASVGINGKVTLTYLTSGANTNTYNPYVQRMLNAFDAINNNPINIIQKSTIDDADYQQSQLAGNYSMFQTGWGPTYLDPYAFLESERLDGDMSSYMGLSRLVNNVEYNADGSISKVDINPTYNYVVEKNDFVKEMTDVTNQMIKADNQTDTSTRYKEFAKSEVDLLYKYKISFPMYVPNGEQSYYLTYVDESTASNNGFGNSQYRYENTKLFSSLNQITNNQNKNEEIILNKEI